MHKSLKSARSSARPAGAFESETPRVGAPSSAGVEVTLYWQPTLDEPIVCVREERHGAYFEIRPQHYLALDVYQQAYAYADFVEEYEKENGRAAWRGRPGADDVTAWLPTGASSRPPPLAAAPTMNRSNR